MHTHTRTRTILSHTHAHTHTHTRTITGHLSGALVGRGLNRRRGLGWMSTRFNRIPLREDDAKDQIQRIISCTRKRRYSTHYESCCAKTLSGEL